jgi:hypothetical protein
MATTTNYSWTTPDDTALVKDGAAAIRSLGTAIDSTVFTNAGAAINKSLVDAAGDLIYGTADNTVARLAIGTADQVLKVNSGATAPEWGTAPSGGMTLISTTTFNGTPTTVLSSIPQTYNNLRIVIRQALPANDNVELRMRMNNDATANRYRTETFATMDNQSFDFNDDRFLLCTAIDNAVTQSLVVIDIPDYTNTTTRKMVQGISACNNSTTTANVSFRSLVGAYNQTSAISSLGFYFSSGNATSGSILLYGVK